MVYDLILRFNLNDFEPLLLLLLLVGVSSSTLLGHLFFPLLVVLLKLLQELGFGFPKLRKKSQIDSKIGLVYDMTLECNKISFNCEIKELSQKILLQND
jgi:hypothetical protein